MHDGTIRHPCLLPHDSANNGHEIERIILFNAVLLVLAALYIYCELGSKSLFLIAHMYF